jgi:hypothetical protein
MAIDVNSLDSGTALVPFADPAGEFLPVVLERGAEGGQTHDADDDGQLPGAERMLLPFGALLRGGPLARA